MKGKKLIFLFLALLFPVVIFLFLKTFGQNEFEVPVLHQQADFLPPPDCGLQYPTPYRVADSLIAKLRVNNRDSLFVFFFKQGEEGAMNRIRVEFRGDPVQVISPADIPESVDARFLRECILLTPKDSSVAVVDHAHRIRGYYKGDDRKDVDRLIVEMKIILKQY